MFCSSFSKKCLNADCRTQYLQGATTEKWFDYSGYNQKVWQVGCWPYFCREQQNDGDMKGFCLDLGKDFNKFSDEQKQQLIEHHGKALKIERF